MTTREHASVAMLRKDTMLTFPGGKHGGCGTAGAPSRPGRGGMAAAAGALLVATMLLQPRRAAGCIAAADERPMDGSSPASLAAGAVCRCDAGSRDATQRLTSGHHLGPAPTAGAVFSMPEERQTSAAALAERLGRIDLSRTWWCRCVSTKPKARGAQCSAQM